MHTRWKLSLLPEAGSSLSSWQDWGKQESGKRLSEGHRWTQRVEASGGRADMTTTAGPKAPPLPPRPPPDLSRKPRLIDAPETSGLS